MQAPRFWQNPPDRPGLTARFLSPLGRLYAAGTARRLARAGRPLHPGIPVICVGNLNVGGTGKTPTVIALIERLGESGRSPAIVSRGYGGTLEGPVQVDPQRHRSEEVGDEPLLLAAFAPVWVARDRAKGAAAAAAAGADTVLLDDGFQNPSVAKDLSIIVVDAARGFGNGRVLPAGPLREPVNAGMARADLLLSIGQDEDQRAFHTSWGSAISGIPHVTARIDPLVTGMDWTGQRVLAFAGIGAPEKFFRTLRDVGAVLVQTVPLADHQALTTTLMARLESEARSGSLQLVTTEKDAVRLPQSFRQKVLTLPVRLTVADWSVLDTAIDTAIAAGARTS